MEWLDVLTDAVIRMEYAKSAGVFEDRKLTSIELIYPKAFCTFSFHLIYTADSTIAMMNRNLPVPQFSSSTNGGILSIKTASVALSYTLGQPFSPSTLSVASADSSSAFKGWAYGQPFPGTLLGTIRGLDRQNNTSLNCTLNSGTLDNGEFNR